MELLLKLTALALGIWILLLATFLGIIIVKGGKRTE